MGKNKTQLGELEASLVKKLDDYVDLTKTNPDINSETRMGIIRKLIKDFLEGKVLTKDFIELEHYYYFNRKELLENGTVKAVPEEPFSDFDNSFTVKAVPNNLDSFDVETNSYCYGNNSNIHKGIYIYHEHGIESNSFYANPVPLLFNYDMANNFIIISLVKIEDFTLFVKSEEDIETINSIVEYEHYFQNNFKIINEDGSQDLNIELCFTGKEIKVIEDFKGKKIVELLNEYDKDMFKNTLLNSDIETDINLNNPIGDLINSNVAKDKELKEINERYVKPLKEVQEKLKELDFLKWEDVKKEYE